MPCYWDFDKTIPTLHDLEKEEFGKQTMIFFSKIVFYGIAKIFDKSEFILVEYYIVK